MGVSERRNNPSKLRVAGSSPAGDANDLSIDLPARHPGLPPPSALANEHERGSVGRVRLSWVALVDQRQHRAPAAPPPGRPCDRRPNSRTAAVISLTVASEYLPVRD